jgi:hypothetical protein
MLVVMKISLLSLSLVTATVVAACNNAPKPEDKKQPAAVAAAEVKADLRSRR